MYTSSTNYVFLLATYFDKQTKNKNTEKSNQNRKKWGYIGKLSNRRILHERSIEIKK